MNKLFIDSEKWTEEEKKEWLEGLNNHMNSLQKIEFEEGYEFRVKTGETK